LKADVYIFEKMSEFGSSGSCGLKKSKDSQLQSACDALLQENAVLRSQFERALPLQDQWEQTKAENKRLAFQLTELKSERENLVRRLDISLQTNRELTARLSEEKKSSIAQR
jgi:hypothetical protein